jgi:hypothetical protein
LALLVLGLDLAGEHGVDLRGAHAPSEVFHERIDPVRRAHAGRGVDHLALFGRGLVLALALGLGGALLGGFAALAQLRARLGAPLRLFVEVERAVLLAEQPSVEVLAPTPATDAEQVVAIVGVVGSFVLFTASAERQGQSQHTEKTFCRRVHGEFARG